LSATLDKENVEKANQLQTLMRIADDLDVPYTYNWTSSTIDFSTATQDQTESLIKALGEHGELID